MQNKKIFESREELIQAINAYPPTADIEPPKDITDTYGTINNWDVSQITDMRDLFMENAEFNQPIDKWDVSNVATMEGMFADTLYFDQAIGGWNVSNVFDMNFMFYGAQAFNHPIDDWDVSNVISMEGMFMAAEMFDQNIEKWKVYSVISMQNMFANAPVYNSPLNEWTMHNVRSIYGMFSGALLFNKDLDKWDIGDVKNTTMLFKDSNFNRPIGNWDTSNIEYMDAMFSLNSAFNQPIGEWDVSNVTSMNSMFRFTTSFDQPIGQWNVSNVTDMRSMFEHASSFNQPLDNWNVEKVLYLDGMFENAVAFNQNLLQWREKLPVNIDTDISNIFNGARNFNSQNWLLPGEANNDDDDDDVNIINYGHHSGVAFEVHNVFRSFNISKYIDDITKYLNSKDIPNQYNAEHFHTLMEETVNNSSNEQSSKNRLIESLNTLYGRIKNAQLSKQIQDILSLTMAWVWSDDFTTSQRQLYTESWIQDNMGAYGNEGMSDISCMQGIIERYVLILQNILLLVPDEERTNIQKQIISLFSPPVIADVYIEWKIQFLKKLEDENRELFVKLIPSPNETPEEKETRLSLLSDEDGEIMTNSFKTYAKNAFENYYGNSSKFDSPSVQGYISYVFEHIQNGGSKKKQKTPTKTHKNKNKRVKTKTSGKKNGGKKNKLTKKTKKQKNKKTCKNRK